MADDAERWCKTCEVNHPSDAFEKYKVNGEIKYRLECKKARQARRKASVKEAPKIDPNTVPLPDECIKCGKKPPEAEFKWRADLKKGGWRNVCNRCCDVNSDGISHSQVYRKREMEKDPKAYRERNAKSHLEWAHRNPDKIKEQQQISASDPTRRFKALLTYLRAKQGDEPFEHLVDMMDAPAMQAKMSAPCHYCGHTPGPNEALNGLDRVHPRGRYDDINTVACCGVCNSMKLTFPVDEFIKGVRDIVAYKNIDIDTSANVPLPPAFGGTAARCNTTKDKVNKLPIDTMIALWADECYLCGRGPAFGIDRVDARKSYTIDNCKSCCTLCNYMKKDWTLQEFFGQIARIYRHTAMWTIGDTSNVMNGITGPRQPVGAYDKTGKEVMVFPSNACAANIIGITEKALRLRRESKGMNWRTVDVKTYKHQYIARDEAMAIIQRMRM